ncbi:MAG: hypothetical protein IBX72_00405 [Nitrospirae bacterium]|jgi:hypothetical protein|nr:hypothetical protein [Nitrospirota bacterium]
MIELVRRIYKQGIIILLPLAVISAFFEWKKLPISILLGGALGLANLKGLEWGLERLLETYRPRGKLLFLSFFRFFILACILLILAVFKLVNFFGILIGFTVVFVLILKEGIRSAARESSTKE